MEIIYTTEVKLNIVVVVVPTLPKKFIIEIHPN